MSNQTKPANLMDGLLSELNRNRELLNDYKAIGPAGTFGAIMIQSVIQEGEAAIASGDTLKMLRAFEALQDSQ